jgi:hypothetical protein
MPPWGSCAHTPHRCVPSFMHTHPPPVCVMGLFKALWGSFMPLGVSFMPLEALLCPMGLLCTGAPPPPPECAPPYPCTPWGSFMSPEALVCAPCHMCAPPLIRAHPPSSMHTPIHMCMPPPSTCMCPIRYVCALLDQCIPVLNF